MKKKGFRTKDVVSEMNRLNMGTNEGKTNRVYVTNVLNGKKTLTPFFARKMEIILGLEKYSLVNLVGLPQTEFGIQKLKELDRFEVK